MSKIILFDLDGTLTDSAEGITKSVQYALSRFGIDEPDLTKLRCFVGPPLKEQFMEYCHMPQRQAEVAVSIYRERYSKIGLFENSLYEGILPLLQKLKEEKKVLAVASSKPEIYVKQILEYFKVDQYFDAIVGANMDGTRTNKAEVIEEALFRLGAEDVREDVLMVGDRSYDVEGALKCGIQCVGAAYGYGGSEELKKAGAVFIAETVEDLNILSEHDKNEVRIYQPQRRAAAVRPATKPESRLWKVWRCLYPIGIHYGISFVVSQVAAILLISWYIMKGIKNFDQLSQTLMGQAVLITGIANVIAIIPLSILYKKDIARRIRESRPNSRRIKLKGIYPATILFAITASHLLNELIDFSGISNMFPGYSKLQEQSFTGQSVWLMLLVIVFAAPVVEELVFRGLVLKRIQDYMGSTWGIIISALAFGIYHGNMVQFIYATLLGIAFGVLMSRTNSLKVTIVAHLAANGWSMFGAVLMSLLQKESFPIYLAVLVIFGLIAVFTGVYIVKAEPEEKEQVLTM